MFTFASWALLFLKGREVRWKTATRTRVPQDLHSHREKLPKSQQPFPNLPRRTRQGGEEEKKKGQSAIFQPAFSLSGPTQYQGSPLDSPQTTGLPPRQTTSTHVLAGLPGSPAKRHQTRRGSRGHRFLGRRQRNPRLLPLPLYLHQWQQPRTKLATGENHTKGNSLGPEKCPSGHKSCLNITAISQTEIVIANYKIIFM